MKPPKLKLKKCKVCKCQFMQERHGQVICTFECVIADLKAKDAKREAAKKAETRAAKKALKDNDRAYQTKLAQRVFNAWIRQRDAGKPCISCGRDHQGQWHAGHYRAAGVNTALRFDPINCHRQCMPCNAHLSGNLVGYRAGLIQRIGLEQVEALDANHEIKKWSIDELKAITETYRKMMK